MEKNMKQPNDPRIIQDEQDAGIRSAALSDEALEPVAGGADDNETDKMIIRKFEKVRYPDQREVR